MTKPHSVPDTAAHRRRVAEEKIRRGEVSTGETLSPEESRQTLHELRVHQIELEMQNEELRGAQVELEAVQERYFDLYDRAPVGYCTLSERGLILQANLTVATLLGVPRGALVKQPITRFILPDDQDIYYRHRNMIFETGAPQACQLRMLRADAAPLWVHLAAAVAQDDEAPAWRVVISDISGLKQAEAEMARLEAKNRQLQKAESLGRMAGAIAHQLNNQLLVIIGNLDLALAELPSATGEVGDFLVDAAAAARRASEVGGLMLTYLGQTPGQREPLDLAAACRRSLPMLRAAMPKNVVLESDLPSPGPVVRANANRIQQVLTILVTNALEAGGSSPCVVRVSVKTAAASEISARHRFPVDAQIPRVPWACLEVADNGCGIAAIDIDKIFDPYFSSKFAGRGMGLPVILGIVRSHDGLVTVESEPDGGSAFRVYIPLTADEMPRSPDAAAEAEDACGGGTMLLVDDQTMVRHTTAAMLARLGYTVLAARNGGEAVEMLRQHADDVRFVLCDLTMPGMDGWETLAALRQVAPGVPVILTSGHGEAHLIGGTHRERPQARLTKPYGRAQLSEAIHRALAGKRDA